MIEMRTILGVTLAALMLAGCSGEHNDAYVGYVEAEYVYIGAPQPGWLVALPVREGDEVASGAVLFELDKDQQEAQLAAATARAKEAGAMVDDISAGARPEELDELEARRDEARVRLIAAKSEYDRWTPLVQEGNASAARGDEVAANYNAAQARVAAAEDAIAVAKLGGREGRRSAADAAADAAIASVREAQWRLDERTVFAETAGTVEEIFHRKGEYVGPATPVLAILPDAGLKVRFFVPQAALSNIALGETVEIRTDGADESITAKVSFIAQEAEFTPPVIYSAGSREKLVFLVEARPETVSGLRPGLPVDVIAP